MKIIHDDQVSVHDRHYVVFAVSAVCHYYGLSNDVYTQKP